MLRKNALELDSNPDGKSVKPNGFGVRHVQCLLMLSGMVFGYFLRVNMSAAVVAMGKPSPNNPDIPFYDWDPKTKSLILSSFFWGYVVAQLPAGILAKKFGPKVVLALATAACSVLTVFIPLAASSGGWGFVCGLRVFIGLFQGVVYPCIHTLLAKWAPKPERGFLSTFVYSGAQLGTVIMLATSGSMTDSEMGWPSIFYISGGITLAWSVLYYIFGADCPETVKVISSAEKDYIQNWTGSSDSKNMAIPWADIFTSVPFYALLFAHCGFTWGFYTLLTEIPSYLDSVLQLDVGKNSLLSALPYFVMWVLCLIVSPISDLLINREILGVEASRKLFNSIGQWVPMCCLIALGYMSKDQPTLAITFLTLGVGFNSASFVGYLVNHMDLAPNFAGTMMGITNGISNLLSIFAPLVVGAVVQNEEDPSEWRVVFFITAGTYLVCNTIFVIFGKASVQPWNEPNLITATTSSQANLPANLVDHNNSISMISKS